MGSSDVKATEVQSKAEGNLPAPAPQADKRSPKRRGSGAGRVARRSPSLYQVFGTVVEMPMRIGDKDLARAVENQWEGIHHSIHYLTDFSRRSLKGKVVRMANRGIFEYLVQKTEESHAMLKVASEKAEENGIRMGRAGTVKELVVLVSSEVERDVIDLIKVLDDYVIVMDSLWIGRVVDTKVRDEAHDDVIRTISKLNVLLTKMRAKMIEFRRLKMSNRLSKDENLYASELENLITDVTGINMRKITEAEEAAESATRKAAKPVKPMIPNEKPATAAPIATASTEMEAVVAA